MADAFAAVVREASDDEQLALIRAHPDLAGRAALAGERDRRLRRASRPRRASTGSPPADLARFTRLNDAYRERFGFPFVMRVAGPRRRRDPRRLRAAPAPRRRGRARRPRSRRSPSIMRLRIDGGAVSADLVVRGDACDVAVEDGLVAAVGPELPGGREEIDARGHLRAAGRGGRPRPPGRPGPGGLGGLGHRHRAPSPPAAYDLRADMPLNSIPPTLDGASFDAKVAAARGRARVDFALWGGLVPGHARPARRAGRRGVVGFKAFMCPSGVPEFAAADPDVLGRGMERAAALGLPVAVHAEDPAVLAAGPRAAPGSDDARLVRVAPGRGRDCGRRDGARRWRAQTGCAVHLVHLSSAGGGRPRRRGRAREGVDATCETCPHYLVLDAADADAHRRRGQVRPPATIGRRAAGLWERVAAGAIDLIGSDHSPGPPEMKRGDDMFAVWGGSPGRRRPCRCCSPTGPATGVGADRDGRACWPRAPARRLGLAGKGGLRPGRRRRPRDRARRRGVGAARRATSRTATPCRPSSGTPPDRARRAHDPARRHGPRPGRRPTRPAGGW